MGPPEACEGGVVYAYRTTRGEASDEIARSGGSSKTAQTVPITGNDSADEAAVQAEMESIHEQFDPNEPDGTLALQASCNNGQDVGTWRRADFKIRAHGVRTRVEGNVYYRRISCAKWRISSVEMTPSRQPRNNLWFRNFFYRSAIYDMQAGKQCWLMPDNETTVFNPNWVI